MYSISPCCSYFCRDVSFNAQSSGNGLSEILCIRNPSYTASAIGFSPHIAGMLALGLTNGNVNLIDKQKRSVKPLLQQSNKSNTFANTQDPGLMGALGGGSTVLKSLQAVTDLQFDTLSATYLLVSYQCYIILWDIETGDQMHIFDKTATLITSINWLSWTSGNFVVTNAKNASVAVYNVSQKQPIETIKLVSNPIGTTTKGSSAFNGCGVSCALVLNNRRGMFCSLLDGSVLYFNLQRHQLEFQSSSGHTETIFDATFCPHSPDVLATVSYDQTIKVWSLVDASLMDTIDVKDGVIYSIDWNCKHNIVAVGTISGSIFVYEMDTGKMLITFKYHKKAVACVRWSKLEPDLLLSSSHDGCIVVNETSQEDLYEHVNKTAIGSKGNRNFHIADRLIFNFNHAVSACGCAWHPFDANFFAAAFFDGSVRLWDYHSKQVIAMLSGHSEKVFQVQWSPLKNGLLATSSDDKTIGVWNVPHDTLTGFNPKNKHEVIKQSSFLKGHQNKVRALCWSTEHRRILISGSWDCTLRLWDVVSSMCVGVVEDHASDIYAVVTHRSRPFQVVSTSRDNTIRVWELPLVSDRMRAVAVWNGDIDRCVPTGNPMESSGLGFDRDDEDDDDGSAGELDLTGVDGIAAEGKSIESHNSAQLSKKLEEMDLTDGCVSGAGTRNMNWMKSPAARRAQNGPMDEPPWRSFSIPLELCGAEGGRVSAAIHNMFSHYKSLCVSETETAHPNLPAASRSPKVLRKLTGTSTSVVNSNFNKLSTNECLVVGKSYQAIYNFFTGGLSGMAELWEAVLMLLQAQSTREEQYTHDHERHKEKVRNALRLQRQEVDLDPEAAPMALDAVPPTPSPKSIINSLFPGNMSVTTLSRNVKLMQTKLTRPLLLDQDILGKAKSEARQAEMNKIIPHAGGQGKLRVLNLNPNATPPHANFSNKVQEQLKEAALMHIRCGDFKKYCTIMIELNEWQLALSIAPAVSLDYWKEVSMSYAQHVINTRETERDCIPYIIAASSGQGSTHPNPKDQMDEAVRFYLHRKEHTKAMVVAKAQEGEVDDIARNSNSTHTTPDQGRGNDSSYSEPMDSPTLPKSSPAMKQIIDAYAIRLLEASQPLLAAAQYICIGDSETAITILSCCGAHDCALALARCFNRVSNELLVALADMLACRGDIEEALEVLSHLDDEFGASSRPGSGADGKAAVPPVRGQSPGPGRPGASVSVRMRETGLLLCRYCNEEELSMWMASNSVTGGLACSVWTARADEESDVGCDMEACYGYMIGKTKEEHAVRLSTAVLRKNLRNAWGSSQNLADFVRMTKYMDLVSEPCPGVIVRSAVGASLDPNSEVSRHKEVMLYLLWYCAHNAALSGYWDLAWNMLRILRENIQMYSANSFKSLALSAADVFVQVLLLFDVL